MILVRGRLSWVFMAKVDFRDKNFNWLGLSRLKIQKKLALLFVRFLNGPTQASFYLFSSFHAIQSLKNLEVSWNQTHIVEQWARMLTTIPPPPRCCLLSVHHPVIHIRRLTTEATTCRSKTFLTIRDEKVVAIDRNVGNDKDEEREQVSIVFIFLQHCSHKCWIGLNDY